MGNCSDAYVIDARLTCLRALMKNTGWPLEQALNALKIPPEAHITYTMMLGEDVSENSEAIVRENMEKGREEGRKENLLSNLKNLIRNTGWSLEKAMEVLGVPQDERPQYTHILTEQKI